LTGGGEGEREMSTGEGGFERAERDLRGGEKERDGDLEGETEGAGFSGRVFLLPRSRLGSATAGEAAGEGERSL
jgi:hypothetical protein